MASTIHNIEAAYDKATGAWTGLDWSVNEGVDTPEYRAEVESDAAAAEEEGREALLLAHEGRWDEALDAARRAVMWEVKYGDSPTWGPLHDAVEEAIVEMDEAIREFHRDGWEPLEPMGDGYFHAYQDEGPFGIIGNGNDWAVVHAEDGVEVDESAAHHGTPDAAAAAADRLEDA